MPTCRFLSQPFILAKEDWQQRKLFGKNGSTHWFYRFPWEVKWCVCNLNHSLRLVRSSLLNICLRLISAFHKENITSVDINITAWKGRERNRKKERQTAFPLNDWTQAAVGYNWYLSFYLKLLCCLLRAPKGISTSKTIICNLLPLSFIPDCFPMASVTFSMEAWMPVVQDIRRWNKFPAVTLIPWA